MGEKEIFELKQKIDKAKIKLAEQAGTRNHLMRKLQKDWECSTVKQAEEKDQQMSKEIEKLDKTIDAGIVELEKII
jgi:hypothetical protein